MKNALDEKIAIIGAGLVGSLLSLFLAKRGFHISVYERRPDLRGVELQGGRSINLALSTRGWKALEAVDMDEKIRAISLPMKGRKIHAKDGKITFQPYGKESQAIYSVSRGQLNQLLLEEADRNENVNLFFNEKCLDIDLSGPEITFLNSQTKKESVRRFDRIFGTDGAFSAIRASMQKTDRFNYQQFYLEHGYKELEIPASENGTHLIDNDALHIWPRGKFMMIALPNLDGSFTCTLFFPFEGDYSFDALHNEETVMSFFLEEFPDAVPLMPSLVKDFFNNPTSSLVTVKCSPWNVQDRVLILGDASHAIVPFYGQGMNSGFEDCTVFDACMDQFESWTERFNMFSKNRKPDTDAISDLALRNHIEMRDLTADPKFLLRKKIESYFSEKYPDKWMPLYSQVTFSHKPYSYALNEGVEQDKIMAEIMSIPNIDKKWKSEEVEKRLLQIIEKRGPRNL